jgi:hypothetical protein
MKLIIDTTIFNQYSEAFTKVLIDYSPKLIAAFLLFIIGIWSIRFINGMAGWPRRYLVQNSSLGAYDANSHRLDAMPRRIRPMAHDNQELGLAGLYFTCSACCNCYRVWAGS